MKLRTQLVALCLACGLAPLAIAALVSYFAASNGLNRVQSHASRSLETKVMASLEVQRDLKMQYIGDYFQSITNQIVTLAEDQMIVDALPRLMSAFTDYPNECNLSATELNRLRSELANYYTTEFTAEYRRQNNDKGVNAIQFLSQLDNTGVSLQHAFIRDNPNPLGSKHLLVQPKGNSTYADLHSRLHPVVKNYLEKFGFYDIFLVDDESGRIVYTVFKELDFGTSLLEGAFAKTNLGQVFQSARILPRGEYAAADFACYAPSYEAPAGFVAAPVFDGDKRLGVAIFQLPIDRITRIMSTRVGLGKTGETLLVGKDGLMRSDSFLDPTNHNLIPSFRNPTLGKCESETIRRVHDRHETGVVRTTDYLGNEVLSAYAPMQVFGEQWCIEAKINVEDAMEPIVAIEQQSTSAKRAVLALNGLVALSVSLILVATAWVMSGRISRPIVRAAEFAHQIAEGDLSTNCTIVASSEVGNLIDAMNTMRVNLRSMVTKMITNADTLGSTSLDLSATASQLASGAEEATHQASTVASAAEEMSTSMQNIATHTLEVSSNIQSMAMAADSMNADLCEVSDRSQKASQIADQAADLVQIATDRLKELNAAGDQIGSIVALIEDIAEQTNLLALNATLEAARAGTAGNGFNVVAREVKELAKQTGLATKDIRTRVVGIQNSTCDVVSAIDEITSVIRNVKGIARDIATNIEAQTQATRSIANTVATTAERATAVADGIRESATVSKEISRNITSVDTVAKQTAVAATQTKGSSGQMQSLASDLKILVREFRI